MAQEFYDKNGDPIERVHEVHVVHSLISEKDADKLFSLAAWLIRTPLVVLAAAVFTVLPVIFLGALWLLLH